MENEKIKVCLEIQPKLKKYFEQFLNQKITKIDGTVIQKIKKDPEFTKI